MAPTEETTEALLETSWLQMPQTLTTWLPRDSVGSSVIQILIIAALFHVVELISTAILRPLLAHRLTPKKETGLHGSNTVLLAAGRCVGTVHNSIAIPIALLLLLDPTFRSNRLYGYSSTSLLLTHFSAGFFLHDLCCCILRYELEGPAYLLHAACCTIVFGYAALGRVLGYYAAAFLMWELSTPFVHLRWLLHKTGQDDSLAYLVVGVLMIASFGAARVGWGTYASVMFWKDAGVELLQPPHPGSIPHLVLQGYRVSNMALNSLNYFWFYKMVTRASAILFGGKPGSHGNTDKDE